MARYIDADKFIEWLDVGHLRPPSEICLSELNVKKMIELQPTADVQRVIHGEWIVRTRKGVIHCSICNNVIPLSVRFGEPLKIHYNYCPCCGAKMK